MERGKQREKENKTVGIPARVIIASGKQGIGMDISWWHWSGGSSTPYDKGRLNKGGTLIVGVFEQLSSPPAQTLFKKKARQSDRQVHVPTRSSSIDANPVQVDLGATP